MNIYTDGFGPLLVPFYSSDWQECAAGNRTLCFLTKRDRKMPKIVFTDVEMLIIC